jgi:hypothetical protein
MQTTVVTSSQPLALCGPPNIGLKPPPLTMWANKRNTQPSYMRWLNAHA